MKKSIVSLYLVIFGLLLTMVGNGSCGGLVICNDSSQILQIGGILSFLFGLVLGISSLVERKNKGL